MPYTKVVFGFGQKKAGIVTRNLYLATAMLTTEVPKTTFITVLKKIHLFKAIAIIKDIVFNSKSYD
jgi:hypothetical protein